MSEALQTEPYDMTLERVAAMLDRLADVIGKGSIEIEAELISEIAQVMRDCADAIRERP